MKTQPPFLTSWWMPESKYKEESVYMKFKLALATLSVVVGLAIFSGFSSSNDKEFHEAKRNITSIQPTKFFV